MCWCRCGRCGACLQVFIDHLVYESEMRACHRHRQQTTNCFWKSNYLRQTTSDFPTLIFPNCSFVSENWCLEQATVVKYCVILPLYLLFDKKLNRARQACSWPGIPSRRLLCVTKHSPALQSPLSPLIGLSAGMTTFTPRLLSTCNVERRKWAIWPQSEPQSPDYWS